MAQGAQMLRRIAAGTYRDDELDVDAENARFLEAMRDIPLATVHLQAAAARGELLAAWAQLPEMTEEAAFWVRKAGPDHSRSICRVWRPGFRSSNPDDRAADAHRMTDTRLPSIGPPGEPSTPTSATTPTFRAGAPRHHFRDAGPGAAAIVGRIARLRG